MLQALDQSTTVMPDGTKVIVVQQPLRKSVRVADLRARFDEYLNTDFPGRRHSTVAKMKSRTKEWLDWFRDHRFSEVSATTLAEWSKHLSTLASDSVIENSWVAMRRMMRWAERMDMFDKNPATLVRPPFRRRMEIKQPAAMDPESYKKIRALSNGHWVDWLFVLSWYTGMALIDCCTLKWGEVDMKKCLITKLRVKTGTPFTVPFEPRDELHEGLMVKLANCGGDPKPTDWVDKQIGAMATRHGEPHADFARAAMSTVFDKAGIPKNQRFHSIRHARASQMVNAGNDIITVAKITGHKSLEQLAQYVHLDERGLRQAMDKTREAYAFDPGDIGERKEPKPSKSAHVWQPGKVYKVKGNKGHKYQDGSPIKFVRTHPNASARREPVRPCDHNGKDTVSYDIEMDKVDVIWLSTYF